MPQMCPNCSKDNPDNAQTCLYCQELLLKLLGKNTRLDRRYQMTQVLGCGGFGAVYLAEDSRISGRQVAVKENRPDPTANPQAVAQTQQQFRAEVDLMIKLRHPGLPNVSDQFTEPSGRQYMVMDYIEGETLEDIIQQRGALPEAEVIDLTQQLLDILEYLHSQQPPIVHRDVKPANIKRRPDGQMVLVDFGIAKVHGQSTQSWAKRAGTPGFAPLEQYGHGGASTDARSDIYSLGAVMYYLLTGQEPPSAPDLAAGTPLTPPHKIKPQLSLEIQGVVFKAMGVNVNHRYQSVAEMRQVLLEGDGKPSPQPPPPPLPKRIALSWIAAVGGVSVILICLILVLIVALNNEILSPTAMSTLTLTSIARTNKTPTTDTTMLTEIPAPPPGPTWTLIPMPTNTPPFTPTTTDTPKPLDTSRLIAYTTGSEGTWQIFIANPTTGEIWLLPGQLPNSGVPAWSPDGNHLAFRSNDSGTWHIYTINIDGTNLRQLTYGGNNNLEAAWSPNGTQIAFVSERDGNKEIYVMESDGRNQRRLTINPGWDDDPNWSPDGRWLIFESKRENRMDIYRMQAGGSDLVRLTGDGELNSTPAWSPDGTQIAFERKSGSTYHIWIMDAGGNNQRQLTPDGKRNLRPAWSPDGSEIVYTSDRDGVEAVWIIPIDGSKAPRRLSPGNGFDAAWSRY